MNRTSDEAQETFRKRKVLTLEEVAALVGRSIHTVRRRLKAWRAHTSYNQNGRYYALPDVPEFNGDGLWRCRGVFFSRYGNLKQTVAELVRCSQAGLDAAEMRSLLGLDPRSFLSAFAAHPQLKREKTQGRFVYYWAEPSIYAQQMQRRTALSTRGRQATPVEAIAILVEKIRHPHLSDEDLSRRLRTQNLFVEPGVIQDLFARHRLSVKKTPRSV